MTDQAEKTVLVLQGGGALGAYQAGAYEALCEAGHMPSWVAGISIGSVNAAIIAGNPPEKRAERLREADGGDLGRDEISTGRSISKRGSQMRRHTLKPAVPLEFVEYGRAERRAQSRAWRWLPQQAELVAKRQVRPVESGAAVSGAGADHRAA